MKYKNMNVLAFAIILQAIEDYRTAKKEFAPDEEIEELEEFFTGEWCEFLLTNTKVTGREILELLKNE